MPYKDAEKGRSKAREYYRAKKKPQQKERTIALIVRLPETIMGRLSQMATAGQLTGKYPWKSVPQTAKAMIGLGLKQLAKEGDFEIDETVAAIEFDRVEAEVTANRRRCQSLVERSKTEINALKEIGAENEALVYYDNVLEHVEEMTTTTWSKWVEKEMKALYPELAQKRARGEIPGVSLKTPAGRKAERDRENRGLRMIDQPKKKRG